MHSSFPSLCLLAVGKPLPLPKIENPSLDSVAKYLAFYINALCKLFNQHETKSGISETQELVSLTDIPSSLSAWKVWIP